MHRHALPCSLPPVCAWHNVACDTPPCVYTAKCCRSIPGFPRCPPSVFPQPSGTCPLFPPHCNFPLPTLFSPKLLARISLPPSGPSPPRPLALCPTLSSSCPPPCVYPLLCDHSPSPAARPQHPRLSGASPHPHLLFVSEFTVPPPSFFLLACICNRRCDAPACLARTPCLAPTRAHCHTFTVIHSLRAALPLCQSLARPSKILTLPVPNLASLRYAARRAHKHASSWPRDQRICVAALSNPPSLPHCTKTCIPKTDRTAFGESSFNIYNRPQHEPSRCGAQTLGKINTLWQACDSICTSHAMSRALFSSLVYCLLGVVLTTGFGESRSDHAGIARTSHPLRCGWLRW